MQINNLGINILTALASKFEAERNVAIANLSIYVNAPVGVGEHSEVVEEADKLVEKIAASEEKLKVVQALLTPPPKKEEDDS